MAAGMRHTRTLMGALGLALSGCGTGVTGGDATTDTSAAKRTYESPGGLSGLELGSAESGAAEITSFDPGAFAVATSTTEEAGINPAEFEEDPPPPPPRHPPRRSPGE